MIDDLDRERRTEKITADVLVIGAGTVGLPISVMLAARPNLKVVCLESGGHHQDGETHPLNEVVHRANEYRGASAGRFRCYGGTSTRWGGALIPFQHADFDHGDWPLSAEELDPYVAPVEDLFGLERGPYTDERFPFPLGRTHVNRLAKWPVFKKRNVVSLIGDEARKAPNLSVWVNATVTEIDVPTASGGVQVVARSPAGNRLEVSAARLLIAAGAIETTRLALLIDRRHGGRVSAASPSLGRYFSDHIGMAVAEIVPRRRDALNKLCGWRFGRGGSMRNIRFELAPDAAVRRELPPSFAYLSPSVTNDGGWASLRELYRYAQRQRVPPVSAFVDAARNLPWIARAGWWRFVHQRLLLPDGAVPKICIVQEQVLDPDNRIVLSAERSDQFGVPLAEITWRPTATDIDNVIRSATLFAETWRNTEFAAYGTWQGYSEDSIRRGMLESGGVYHPTGSTRMGRDAATGVVDRDLRMFACPQVQLISTSVLPTGGGANPTMMALMLGVRCVDQLLKGA
jgi:choline dehydrogenase-like flavoprotein